MRRSPVQPGAQGLQTEHLPRRSPRLRNMQISGRWACRGLPRLRLPRARGAARRKEVWPGGAGVIPPGPARPAQAPSAFPGREAWRAIGPLPETWRGPAMFQSWVLAWRTAGARTSASAGKVAPRARTAATTRPWRDLFQSQGCRPDSHLTRFNVP